MKSDKRKVYYEGRIIEVSNDVYAVLIKTDRKMKYIEEELKEDKIITNDEGVIIAIIPSREDSYERLQEENKKVFSDNTESVEERAIKNIYFEQLHKAISLLKPDEQALIEALYFKFLSQREYASSLGVSQAAICKKQKRILKKLKILLKI